MTHEEVIAFLAEKGKKIGEEAYEGTSSEVVNTAAAEVIAAYAFHWKAPGDPGGKALLEMAVEKYKEAKASQ